MSYKDNIDVMERYLVAMKTAANSLKVASLLDKSDGQKQAARQMEILLNEIDSEISKLKSFDIREDSIKQEVNERLSLILMEANKIASKDAGNSNSL